MFDYKEHGYLIDLEIDGFDSIIPISNLLHKKIKVFSFDTVNYCNETTQVYDLKLSLKDTNIWKITTSNNKLFICSDYCSILTMDGWKYAMDLVYTDRLIDLSETPYIRATNVESALKYGKANVYRFTAHPFPSFTSKGLVLHV